MTYLLMVVSAVAGLLLGMIVELYIDKMEIDRLRSENRMLRDNKPKRIEIVRKVLIGTEGSRNNLEQEDFFEPF